MSEYGGPTEEDIYLILKYYDRNAAIYNDPGDTWLNTFDRHELAPRIATCLRALDGIANPAALPGLIAAAKERAYCDAFYAIGQRCGADARCDGCKLEAALAELHRQPREEAGG